MDAPGVLTIQHNAPEIGQGTHNLFSVVASQTLNMPQSQIRVGTPDTAVNLPFAGVSAQRTTMQMGNAVHNACKTLKEDLLGAGGAGQRRRSQRLADRRRAAVLGRVEFFDQRNHSRGRRQRGLESGRLS